MTDLTMAEPTADELAKVALRRIPALLDEHGWCQGADHDGVGAACLRGALLDVAPAGVVRAYVWGRLTRQVGSIVVYNDTTGRTVGEVQAACVAAAEPPGRDLTGANLHAANFRYVDLRGVNLGGANLGVADLTGADLRGANLTGAYLRSAYLTDAYLTDADLRDANLGGVVGLTAAKLAAALNVDKARNVPTFGGAA